MRQKREGGGQITSDRMRLENPYAHLDEIGGFDVSPFTSVRALQNPYASLATDGLPRADISSGRRGCSIDAATLFLGTKRAEIEESANRLLRHLWKMNGDKAENPVDVINIKAAADAMAVELIYVDPMGHLDNEGDAVEIGATFDRAQNRILISTRPDRRIQNFTGAHELGHLILHHDQIQYHRDLPIKNGKTRSHSVVERQANWFAVEFLMPRKLVTLKFKNRFGEHIPFELSTNNAVGLARSNYIEFFKKTRSPEDLAFVLARAEFFHSNRFSSLADEFNVNVSAMAYRLIELQLIK